MAGCSAPETTDSKVVTNEVPVPGNENVQEVEIQETESLPVDETTTPTDSSDADVLVVELDAFSFGYSQTEIKAKVGQTVKVIMTNTGGNHDFVIDELNARTPIIKTGETTEVEFTVTEAGEFEYYCSVGSHRAAGMVGKLIVSE